MKRLVMIIACASLLATTCAIAQTFEGLGFAPGASQSVARAISQDGSTVVGSSAPEGSLSARAWRWRAGTGVVHLGLEVGLRSFPQSVSANGDFVSGYSTGGGLRGTRWDASGVATQLVGMEQCFGISGDGSTVVGRIDGAPSDNAARRWTQATGAQGFGPLPPGPYVVGWTSAAWAASHDGSVIVGFADLAIQSGPVTRPGGAPFVWTAATGPRALLGAGGSLVEGAALDVTPDGSVIVGGATSGGVSTIFRYTNAGGYQFIPQASQPVQGTVKVASDGNTIISRLTYWTPATGHITIAQALALAGCDYAGWTLTETIDISGDGRTLVGNGLNPQGVQEAWIATIPAPGVVVPLALAGLMTSRRRR